MTSATLDDAQASKQARGIVAVDASRLAGTEPYPVAGDPSAAIPQGEGAMTKDAHLFRSDDQRFTVDVASYEAMTVEIKGWPYDE